MENYPLVSDVLDEMQKNTPAGWVVTYEYPDTIGVWCNSFVSDDLFISLGDVNGYFGFNNVLGDVDGYMEEIHTPAEIVTSFWQQLKIFYPDLLKEIK